MESGMDESQLADLLTGGPSMLKVVAIGSLEPNPFRRLDEYPIQREKVDQLRESYRSTSFWGNILARPMNGKHQIAYGHHRLVALQEEYGDRKKVEIIVRDLSNELMLQIMARENMEEWGTSAWVELETIRAVIEAYGAGEIDLPSVAKGTRTDQLRYVPQRAAEHTIQRDYTKATVAEFLGWTKENKGHLDPNYACETAFRGIDMLDAGFIKESQIKNLSRAQLYALIGAQWEIYRSHMRVAEVKERDAKRLVKEAEKASTPRERATLERKAESLEKQASEAKKVAAKEAKQLASDVVPGIRKGDVSIRDVKAEAAKRTASAPKPSVINLELLAQKTSAIAYRICNDDQLHENLKLIRQYKDDIPGDVLGSMVTEIKAACVRLQTATKGLA